ncbi:site-specific DNA-methyltransferase [Halarcobacter anaerophilus]|uniref:site-specific DNA-methyltransferase n=1 Tax=Halarcobacter anaerophilus TaxID=877500 RepID=UPI0006975E01|nr:site-specific DNA-methyltransferase [Halarcobacter anaerophilus]
MEKYNEYTKEELIKIIQQQENELKYKKYGLVWDAEREPEQVVLDCENSLPILKHITSKTIHTCTDEDNILIEGDNYHALSVLNYTHKEKIDVIYIDPPYNTGSKDFIYNDRFVDKEDGYRHSKWLNFMEKRLNLAKELLTKDGVIFASIDDNEYPRLIMLFEKIFGENNVKTIAVKMSEPTGVKMSHIINNGGIAKLKEYLVIAKVNGINELYLEKIPKEKWDNEYKTLITNANEEDINTIKQIRDNEERTEDDIIRCDEILSSFETISLANYFRENNISTKADKEKFQYDNAYRIYRTVATTGSAKTIADTKKESVSGNFFSIITSRNKMYFMLSNYNEEHAQPRIKILLADDYLTQHPGDFWSDIKTTGLDNEGGVDFTNGKKPIKLIERILKSIRKNKITILDFFAGSGTTGEVVLKLKDLINANFILCTTNDDKEHICDNFTYPRLQYAIDNYGGNLQYFKTDLLKKSNNRHQTKLNLTNKCTEMLCVKENIFNLNKSSDDYKIYSSHDNTKYLCIYFNTIDDSFDEFLEELNNIDAKKIVYMFSDDLNVDKEPFREIENCTLEAIPQKILDIYKQLIKMNIPIKLSTIFTDLAKAKKRIFDEQEKDEGASKLRIVLEKTIQKIAQNNGVPILKPNGKEETVENLNNTLKHNGVFSKVTWQENQTYMAIGNHAAHGDYDEYDLNQVENFYRYTQSLIDGFNIG